MRRIAGKRWFYAQGQRDYANGHSFTQTQLCATGWPLWARLAYLNGTMDQQIPDFNRNHPAFVEQKEPTK